MTERRCDTCEFWVDGEGDKGGGWCARYPPPLMSDERVEANNWCGEWRAVKEDHRGRPVRDLDFSVRVRRALIRKDITTIEELVALSRRELLSFRAIGEASVIDIGVQLAKFGLALRGEEVYPCPQ